MFDILRRQRGQQPLGGHLGEPSRRDEILEYLGAGRVVAHQDPVAVFLEEVGFDFSELGHGRNVTHEEIIT